MKRLLSVILCITLLLVGCSKNQVSTSTVSPPISETAPLITTDNDVATESTEAPIHDDDIEFLAVSLPAITETFTADDGTDIFKYTVQNMQLLHPDEEIANKVVHEFLNRVDSDQAFANTILNAAHSDYTNTESWYPYFYQVIYSPMRIDHGVLSLYGTQNCYGGAYNNRLSCVAANYDMSTGDVLTLGSIMHMDATTDDFISIIIQKLAVESEELGLFDAFEDGVRNRLGGDENLYEDFYFTNTGLTFFFAPYEIAPYASGIITVEIPYEELPGLIYDGYFPAERELVEGTLQTSNFTETDMLQFQRLADVVITTDEESLVVYPDGIVEDVRITISGDNLNMPEYTVFAALKMSSANAIILSIPTDLVERASVQYSASGATNVIPLN